MNQITIQPTVFENRPQGSKTYGYRMYDDYGQTYNNTWESIPDDDLEILRQVIDDGDDIAQNMIGFMIEHGHGLSIGDERYDWNDIKYLFED